MQGIPTKKDGKDYRVCEIIPNRKYELRDMQGNVVSTHKSVGSAINARIVESKEVK